MWKVNELIRKRSKQEFTHICHLDPEIDQIVTVMSDIDSYLVIQGGN